MSRPLLLFLLAAALLGPVAVVPGAPLGRPAPITHVVYTPDGRAAVFSTRDGVVYFWDVVSHKELAILSIRHGVFAVAVSADGKRVATGGGDGVVRLWDARRYKLLDSLHGHQELVAALAFSPDGKKLASGGYDGQVRIWDIRTGKELHTLRGHVYRVTSVSFSPDGRTLASGGIAPKEMPTFTGSREADHVRLWDVGTGKLRQQLPQRGETVCFGPDGRTLAVGGKYLNFPSTPEGFTLEGGPFATLWDLETIAERGKALRYGPAVALSADGKFLACGWGDFRHGGGVVISWRDPRKGIHLFETATSKEVLCLLVAERDAEMLALSPDGTSLAAGTLRSSVRFHSLAPPGWHSGKRLVGEELERAWTALAAPDAAKAYRLIWTLAAGGDRTVSFLKDRLHPARPAGARVRRLLADLDSKQFKEREAAFQELSRLADKAEPELRRTLEGKPSLEVRRRLDTLLHTLQERRLSPERLRESRALVVLERIATKRARELLGELAKGAPAAPLTQDARNTLKRLARRTTEKE